MQTLPTLLGCSMHVHYCSCTHGDTLTRKWVKVVTSLNVLVAHSLIDIYAKCIHAEYIWHIQAQVHLDY
jgi:uncharacterized membrane protein YczE